jgi:uncharacterized protein (DUF1330 family)
MSAYLIVDITVHDRERYAEYVRQVPTLIRKHGGVYRIRGGETQTIEGDWSPRRLVVLEFPDTDAARAFLDDPDYEPVAAIRHEAASTNLVLAEGFQE